MYKFNLNNQTSGDSIKTLILSFVLFIAHCASFASEFKALSPDVYNRLKNLEQNDLKDALRKVMSENFHAVGYDRAKTIIFGTIDNQSGTVCCVYNSHECLKTRSVPSHTKMNVEHTWPQSKGAVGEAKSDLHHLFPTMSTTNSKRSNFPFCEVSKVNWQNAESKQGYNKYNEVCFEPPASHKGDVARALFYFAVKYGKSIDEHEEKIIREWHHEDPVDQVEINRNRDIYKYQGNSNAFVEHPELVDNISNF